MLVAVLLLLSVVLVVSSIPGSIGEFENKLNRLAQSACQCGATDSKSVTQVLQTGGWNGLLHFTHSY